MLNFKRIRIGSILRYYAIILATVLFIYGFYFASRLRGGIVGVCLLLPAIVWMWSEYYYEKGWVGKKTAVDVYRKRVMPVLFYYSLALMTIVAISNFLSARSFAATISAIVFLPIAIYLWWVFHARRSGVEDILMN